MSFGICLYGFTSHFFFTVLAALLQLPYQIVICQICKVLFKIYYGVIKLLLRNKVVVESYFSKLILSQISTCKCFYFTKL